MPEKRSTAVRPRIEAAARTPLNIGDIARRAGVARSTVSYALSGKRAISSEKRKQILALIEKLGYRPNATARALAEGRNRTVGLVLPPPSHRLLDSQLAFVAVLSELAGSADLDLLLSSSAGGHDGSFERMLGRRRVDGVLLMEVRMEDERIAALQRSGIPFVLVGRPADPSGLFWADIDYVCLVERCVDHLADLGHRRIALVNRPAEMLVAGYGPARRSAEAFEAAAARRGLRGQAFCCPDDAPGGDACIKKILAARPQITAAVTINDGALAGINRGFDRARIRLPRDFSLVGVVSERWAKEFRPRMTAAVISPADLARGAFEMLLQRIEDPGSEPRHLLQSPSISLRNTTGPVPPAAVDRPRKGQVPIGTEEE